MSLPIHAFAGLTDISGYHRLWSHRSYTASLPLRICLAACGCAAVQGSIREWTIDHRVHHKFTDTEKDPYSVNKGIFFAHIGWLLHETDRRNDRLISIADLDQDPVVRFQAAFYPLLMFLTAFMLPAAIAGLGWGDWKGGLVYAGLMRMFFLHQATFCVNSMAHLLGDQTFDDDKSAKDSVITAVITFGEGYHNFHHAFPSDYRNATHWYQYDPTAWVIWACDRFGLASELKQIRKNEVKKSVLQQKMKALSMAAANIEWGATVESLPAWSGGDFAEACAEGRKLIVVAGLVHDVAPFMMEHPGGIAMINSQVGKDATRAFNGEVYKRKIVCFEAFLSQ